MTAGPPAEPPILTAEEVSVWKAETDHPRWRDDGALRGARVVILAESHEALRARLRDAEARADELERKLAAEEQQSADMREDASAWRACPWCEGNGRNPVGDVTGDCPKCAGRGHWNPALRAVVILEADPEAVAAWFEGYYAEDEQQPEARDYFTDMVRGLIDDEFTVATMFGPIHVREDDPA